MKRKLLITLFAVLLVVCVVLTACKKSDSAVTLSVSELNLNEGGSAGTLTATVANSTEYVSWSTSDDSVVKLTPMNNVCLVAPLKEGTATVTAKLGDASATCQVKVGPKAAVEVVSILQGDENVTGKTLEVDEGDTLSLTGQASLGSAITWQSSNESVATVANGVVTALRPGTTEITALVTASIKASVTVNVKAPEGVIAYDLLFGDGGQPKTEDGQEIPANTFYYWASRSGWGQQVDIEHAYFYNGTVAIKYTSDWSGSEDPNLGGGYYYGFQLKYWNTALTNGTYYKFTCKLTIDQHCYISIAGVVYELNEGENDVTVYYKNNSNEAFGIMMGYDTMDGTNGYFVKDVDMSISDMLWTPDTERVTLQAPDFTINNGVITINDPNAAGVGSYLLNFYNAQETRVAGVPVVSGKAVDTSLVPNGTYTVKLVAVAENLHYIDSAESSTTATVTVANDGVRYELEAKGAGGAVTNPGIWTYYKSSWVEIRQASFEKDTLTFSFSKNEGNWDDTQLYYRSPETEAGKYYKITLEITCNASGHIYICGQEVEILEGTHTYEVPNEVLQEANGTTISFIFALYGQSNAQEIPEGEFKIKIVSIEEGTTQAIPQPSNDPSDYNLGEKIYPSSALENNGEGDASMNTWAYWYVADSAWGLGSVVNMKTAESKNGTVTLAYVGGEVDFAVQLFYKNSNVTSKQYFVFATIELNTALTIKLNGEVKTLGAGTHNLFVLSSGGTSFSLQLNGSSEDVIVKISNVYWQQVVEEQDPSKDPNNRKLGAKVTPSSAWEKNGEGPATMDTWAYWYVEDASWNCGSVVTMKTAEINNGTITFAYTGGSVDFSVQLFYKNSKLPAGKQYFVNMTIELDSKLTIKLNGEVMTLEAGTHEIAVLWTSGGTAFSLQLYGVGANSVTVKISNIFWQEVLD